MHPEALFKPLFCDFIGGRGRSLMFRKNPLLAVLQFRVAHNHKTSNAAPRLATVKSTSLRRKRIFKKTFSITPPGQATGSVSFGFISSSVFFRILCNLPVEESCMPPTHHDSFLLRFNCVTQFKHRIGNIMEPRSSEQMKFSWLLNWR